MTCKRCGNLLNKGKIYCSINCLNKTLGERQRGKNNPAWKGDSTKYSGIHMYLKNTFGRGESCEDCGAKGFFYEGEKQKRWSIEWANLSGKYKRNRGDWKQLCKKCHIKLDKTWRNRRRDDLGRFVKGVADPDIAFTRDIKR